jgi:hypothetical protein
MQEMYRLHATESKRKSLKSWNLSPRGVACSDNEEPPPGG